MSANAQNPALVRRFKHFNAVRSTPTIGATIEGLHLAELNGESAQELRQALWQYGVTRDLVRGAIGAQTRELHRVAAWSSSIRPSLDRETAVSDLMHAMYPSG